MQGVTGVGQGADRRLVVLWQPILEVGACPAIGQRPSGWIGRELRSSADRGRVAFEGDIYLIRKDVAEAFAAGPAVPPAVPSAPVEPAGVPVAGALEPAPGAPVEAGPVGVEPRSLRLVGEVPPEMWNRLGTRILPKLRAASELRIAVELSATLDPLEARILEEDLRRALEELGLGDRWRIE